MFYSDPHEQFMRSRIARFQELHVWRVNGDVVIGDKVGSNGVIRRRGDKATAVLIHGYRAE